MISERHPHTQYTVRHHAASITSPAQPPKSHHTKPRLALCGPILSAAIHITSLHCLVALLLLFLMSSSKPGADPHPHGAYFPHSPQSLFPTIPDNSPKIETDVCSAIELKKDVTIVVCGASGDLAKKKTVLPNKSSWIALTILVSCTFWIGKLYLVCGLGGNVSSIGTTFCLRIPLL